MASFDRPKIRTLCYCWIITRTDGTRLGFTDHDDTLAVNGVECLPETGMVTGSSEVESGFSINGGQVEAALNADAISTEDILNGLYDRATVQHYLTNWQEPENSQLLRTMTIAKVTESNGQFTAEMDGLLSGFDAPQGRYFRRQCDAELGDAQCRINLNNNAYRIESRVLEDADNATVSIEAPNREDTEFINGSLVLNGSTYSIANIQPKGSAWDIGLKKALKTLVQKDTLCTVIKGCDKSFSTCKNRFGNHINFRGFPHLPGGDAAYQFAKSDDVFDGKPIVP